jgi:hypothetical protein
MILRRVFVHSVEYLNADVLWQCLFGIYVLETILTPD